MTEAPLQDVERVEEVVWDGLKLTSKADANMLQKLYVKALNWELSWGILSTCPNPFLSVLEGLRGLTDGLDDQLPQL